MDKKKVMAWFICLIMVLSVGGYIVGFVTAPEDTSASQQSYNGFEFKHQGASWVLPVSGQKIPFRYFPTDLEDLRLPEGEHQLFSQGKVYLAFVPNDTINAATNLQFLGAVISAQGNIVQKACVTEEGCPDIPLMDCETKSGIILRSGTAIRIIKEKQCLIGEAASAADLERLSERLAYYIIGVMP